MPKPALSEEESKLLGDHKKVLDDLVTSPKFLQIPASMQFRDLNTLLVDWNKTTDPDVQRQQAEILLKYAEQLNLTKSRFSYSTYYETAELLCKAAYDKCPANDPILKAKTALNYANYLLNKKQNQKYMSSDLGGFTDDRLIRDFLKFAVDKGDPVTREKATKHLNDTGLANLDPNSEFKKALTHLFPESTLSIPHSWRAENIFKLIKDSHPIAEVLCITKKPKHTEKDLDEIIDKLIDRNNLDKKMTEQVISLLNHKSENPNLKREIADRILNRGLAGMVCDWDNLLRDWMKTPENTLAGYRVTSEPTGDTDEFRAIKTHASQMPLDHKETKAPEIEPSLPPASVEQEPEVKRSSSPATSVAVNRDFGQTPSIKSSTKLDEILSLINQSQEKWSLTTEIHSRSAKVIQNVKDPSKKISIHDDGKFSTHSHDVTSYETMVRGVLAQNHEKIKVTCPTEESIKLMSEACEKVLGADWRSKVIMDHVVPTAQADKTEKVDLDAKSPGLH